MAPLMRLPGYQVPTNAMLDTAPITRAFAGIRQSDEADRQFGIQQEQLGMQKQRLGMEQKRFQRQETDSVRQRIGNLALLTLQEQDEGKRAERWKQVLALHPEAAKLGPNYADASAGPLAVLADAGMAQNYLDFQVKQQQMRLQQAQEARAAAAAGRQAELHPYAVDQAKLGAEDARIGLDIKRRNLEAPPLGKVDLKPGEQTIFYDPRTGEQKGSLGAAPDPNLGPYKDAKQKAEVEEGLRKEITGTSKNYATVRDASAALEAIVKNPSAASDVALIFSFMKILDPTSVVRETEFATAQNAAGVPERVQNVWNRVLSGERLSPQQRADFVNQAQTLSKTQLAQYKRSLDQYDGVAKRLQVDPRNVILDQDLLPGARPTAAPPPPPAAIAPPRATNPQTGEIIEFVDGQWRPVSPANPKTYEGPPPPASR